MKTLIQYTLVLIAALSLSACSRGDDDALVHIYKEEYTPEDQSQIGAVIQQYINNNPFLFPQLERSTNAEIYTYLNTVLETLLTTDDITKRNVFDWELTILQDNDIRSAFSAPGGKIFIYTGLLKFISGENELLSILAHEISYNESGRVMTKLQEEYTKDKVFLGDVLLGKENLEGMDELSLFLKDMTYSENEVIEADNFAIQLICPFQYNALGIKTIIDQASQSTMAVAWLDIRPSASNRIDNILEQAAPCGDEEDPTFAERYEGYKKRLP